MLQVYIPYSLKHAGKQCDDWSYYIKGYLDIVYTADLCEIKFDKKFAPATNTIPASRNTIIASDPIYIF